MPNTKIDYEEIPEIELVYHRKKEQGKMPKILSAENAYKVFRHSWDEGKLDFLEQMRVLLINRENRCIGISTIATGGTAGVYVDNKVIFALAIQANASAIILCHNHPSGILEFSEQDRKISRNIEIVGRALDLPILDHLVISRDGYVSMVETGGIFSNTNENSQIAYEPEQENISPKPTKPILYIFNLKSKGGGIAGAIYKHEHGNGVNIVFDDKSRFVAYPPKSDGSKEPIEIDSSNEARVLEKKKMPSKKSVKAKSPIV